MGPLPAASTAIVAASAPCRPQSVLNGTVCSQIVPINLIIAAGGSQSALAVGGALPATPQTLQASSTPGSMSCRGVSVRCVQQRQAGTSVALARPPLPRRRRSPLCGAPRGGEMQSRQRMLVLAAAAADGGEGGNGAAPNATELGQPAEAAAPPVHRWDALG